MFQIPEVVVLDPIFVSRDVPVCVEHIHAPLVPWIRARRIPGNFNGVVPELLMAQAADVVHEDEKIRIEKLILLWLGSEFTL